MSAATLAALGEADEATISAIDALRADDRHLEAREHYGHLVSRHQRRALSIAYRMLRDPADAEEVVQDAFVKAYLHLPSFRRELPFAAWFTRILTNSCRDRIKTRSR